MELIKAGGVAPPDGTNRGGGVFACFDAWIIANCARGAPPDGTDEGRRVFWLLRSRLNAIPSKKKPPKRSGAEFCFAKKA
jgi:hypothetical protein